jgi:chloramphenicol 3-O-phosphotransferase
MEGMSANCEGIFLVAGISAVGKSTVAQELALRFPRAVHVRGDGFRKMVVTGRVDMALDAPPEALEQLWLRYRLTAQTADAYCAAGFTVVAQDVVYGAGLAPYVELFTGRPLHLVVLCPRPDVIAAREAARPKTAYRDNHWTIEDSYRELTEDTPRLGLWVDSSDQTVAETVDEILTRRGDALVAT